MQSARRVLTVGASASEEATYFTSPEAPLAPAAAFPIDDLDALHSHASLVVQIGIDQPLACRDGKGCAAILPRMAQTAVA
jgi:hypothetical protein